MPLTPGDIRNIAFSKPPIGKRGYNEDEVDAFLDLVQAELARLINENNDLHNRVDQLNKRLRATSADTGGGLHPLVPPRSAVPLQSGKQTSPAGDQHAQTAKVLGMAQEIADRLTRDAKTDADRILSQARNTTVQLLSEAQAKVDGMINEASSRAQTMLRDARTRAETLDRESQEKATALEREAARKHTEILGAINQEKNALEKKIVELSTFEQEYRTRLKTYLNSQLRELDSQTITAPSDTTRNQHNFAASESGAHYAEPKATVLLRNTG
ncbi:MAG: DivIVA-like cell division protein Wag31 [Pseudonocardiaceae bacterium]